MQALLEHWGTAAYRTAPGCYRFECRGRLGTALLMVATVFAGLGVLASALLAILQRAPQLLAGMVMPALLLAILLFLLRRRMRTMGVVLLDLPQRTIAREGGPSWPLGDIAAFETAIDPFERNPAALVHGQARWLTVKLKSGQIMRLCKGHPGEVEAIVIELRAAGLPA